MPLPFFVRPKVDSEDMVHGLRFRHVDDSAEAEDCHGIDAAILLVELCLDLVVIFSAPGQYFHSVSEERDPAGRF